MEQKKKPKYGMGRNVAFMLRTSWKMHDRSIAFLALATALAGAGTGIVQLFITPVVLDKVENAGTLSELLAAILDR